MRRNMILKNQHMSASDIKKKINGKKYFHIMAYGARIGPDYFTKRYRIQTKTDDNAKKIKIISSYSNPKNDYIFSSSFTNRNEKKKRTAKYLMHSGHIFIDDLSEQDDKEFNQNDSFFEDKKSDNESNISAAVNTQGKTVKFVTQHHLTNSSSERSEESDSSSKESNLKMKKLQSIDSLYVQTNQDQDDDIPDSLLDNITRIDRSSSFEYCPEQDMDSDDE